LIFGVVRAVLFGVVVEEEPEPAANATPAPVMASAPTKPAMTTARGA
jgi:hypothetical protein